MIRLLIAVAVLTAALSAAAGPVLAAPPVGVPRGTELCPYFYWNGSYREICLVSLPIGLPPLPF